MLQEKNNLNFKNMIYAVKRKVYIFFHIKQHKDEKKNFILNVKYFLDKNFIFMKNTEKKETFMIILWNKLAFRFGHFDLKRKKKNKKTQKLCLEKIQCS
jgi:hypothetical protein